MIETLLQDARHALRVFRRNAGPTLVGVLALGLGIGANTAMFSVVHAVVLRPLPYPDPDRIVRVWEDSPRPGADEYFLSMGLVRDLRAARSVEHLSEYWLTEMNFADGAGSPERLRTVSAGWRLSHVLGLAPFRGRFFADEDYRDGGAYAAVLVSHGFWQRRYAGRDDAVGRSVRIDDRPATIVGVLPPGTTFEGADIWVNHNDPNTAHQPRYLHALGRLRPGTRLEEARAELQQLAASVAAADPRSSRGWSVVVKSLTDEVVGPSRTALFVLFGAVSLLLLIACANVASLLLAQAEGRAREMAIRAAVGASHGRLARQSLVESALLALAGTGLGLGLAWTLVRLVGRVGPGSVPRQEEIALHWPVFLYALFVALLTTLLFGLAPAWRARRADLEAALHEAGRGMSGGRTARRVRHALVVAQMALAVVLVTAAGLLLKSLGRLVATDVGFVAENVLTFGVALPKASYPDATSTSAFYDRLLDEVEALPGVRAAGVTTTLPLAKESDYRLGFAIVGDAPSPESDSASAWYRMVSPGYLLALGVRLERGRGFDEADTADSEPVVIVNQAFARRYASGRDPVGLVLQTVSGGFGPLGGILTKQPRIVGVVGDTRHLGLDREAEPAIFFPARQAPFRNQTVVVRAQGNPMRLAADVRRAVAAVDPGLPVAHLATLEDQTARAAAAPRLRTSLVSAFAALALLLGAVGLYGALQISVASRVREIGIRLAVGGAPARIRALVLRESMSLVALGIVLGLAGALAASRVLRGLLYGVEAHDPATFTLVPVVLVATALAASWLPARRATRIDPVTALRE
jgi:putative ABC transport system permease protein